MVAHGNSIRALVKHLDGISDEEIVDLNIPTGVPLLYELDDSFSAGVQPLSGRSGSGKGGGRSGGPPGRVGEADGGWYNPLRTGIRVIPQPSGRQ